MGEVAAEDRHGQPDRAQPQAMEERACDHEPHSGQDEQQASEEANPRKGGAVSPPVDHAPSSCHSLSITWPSVTI